ncbi:MAG: pantetheine-phosphate adenylyltransferase [Bacteroidetes bacterium]|nr:pantetheine-phosphate adenylyltransferase [Bacteroidota bacterium]
MDQSKMHRTGLALYPGSFDPFTLGHLDILERACRLFDRVEVTIARNSEKSGFFPTDKRKALIEACSGHLDNVRVVVFDGLLADHAARSGASALVRGLRQVADFDYEFRMAFANRRLAPQVETVFLMPSEEHALITASIVREIHRYGGDVSSFVPEPVLRAMRND